MDIPNPEIKVPEIEITGPESSGVSPRLGHQDEDGDGETMEEFRTPSVGVDQTGSVDQ